MRFARVGESFSKTVSLDAASISTFAALSQDPNPLHHDAAVARRSRFGAVIASGPQTASLLLGLSAEHFTRSGAALGLDFRLQFRKAVKAGDVLTLRWTVTRVEDKPSLKGELVEMAGEVRNQNDELVLSSTGLVLATDTL